MIPKRLLRNFNYKILLREETEPLTHLPYINNGRTTMPTMPCWRGKNLLSKLVYQYNTAMNIYVFEYCFISF